MMDPKIRKMAALAKTWGGSLTNVSRKAWDKFESNKAFERAPFTEHSIGVLWEEKRVVYTGDVPWTDMTHELGHCFASPKTPNFSDEFDFFGWELYLVDYIGGDMAEWLKANRFYQVTEQGDCLEDLSPSYRSRIFQRRRSIARRLKLVSPDGIPLSIRDSSSEAKPAGR